MVLFSCQSEIAQEDYSTQETIQKQTPLTTFVERVVMQKTTQDNMVDHTDCFGIKFPYVITINGVDISLNSADDYSLVENNRNLYLSDDDIVHFHFPITVVFNDYTQNVITDQAQYNNLIHDCEEKNEDLGRINCLNFNYPITIKSYDSNKQVASSSTVFSNKELYGFINVLEDNEFIAFAYPLTITNSVGQIVTINDNKQLEDIIKDALDNCSENLNTSLDFMQTIKEGSWQISYFYNNYQKTASYAGYVFVFKDDYTVTATNAQVTLKGTWFTKKDNGVREFRMDFDNDPFKELNEDWKLFEFNTSEIRFRGNSSNSGTETDYLYFIRTN